MEQIIIPLIIGIVALVIGIAGTIMVQKKLATSKAKTIIDEATAEAENLKKTKILEAREEELKIKARNIKYPYQVFSIKRKDKVLGADAKLFVPTEAEKTNPLETSGFSRFELTIVNNLRNLMGPHHRPDPEPYGVGPTTFSYENEWKKGIYEENHLDRYAFVRFGFQ